MAKKRKTPVRSSSRQDRGEPSQGEVSWPLQPGDTQWTAEHVRKMRLNPVYGYGIVLEPFDAVAEAVMQCDQTLAGEQQRRGKPFSLDELGRRFQELFADLVQRGICTRGPDAPTVVPKETWLKAHQVMIGRIERGEPV